MCVVTVALQVHLEQIPVVDRPAEEEFSRLMTEAGRIVSRLETPRSTVTNLLRRIRENLSAQETDELREQLKREISRALELGGIPLGMIDSLTMVFVNLCINTVEVVHAEPGDSVVLHLKCSSLWALLRLREMILSGLLLRLLSTAIKEFIQSRSRVQLVVLADDFKSTLSCLTIASRMFVDKTL